MIKTEYSFRDKDTGLVLLEFTTDDLLLDFKKFVFAGYEYDHHLGPSYLTYPDPYYFGYVILLKPIEIGYGAFIRKMKYKGEQNGRIDTEMGDTKRLEIRNRQK